MHRLEEVAAGRIRKLIINLPPRHFKSTIVSSAFPAWVLGRNPAAKFVVASYGGELSAEYSDNFRRLLEQRWYRRAFPNLRVAKGTASEIKTTKRGGRLSTSVGGALTGRGGNFLIVDDPIKAEEALSATKREGVNTWFDTTFLSRLDDKSRGAIIVVMQRVHVDDLTGHLSRKGGWDILSLPAIAQVDEVIPIGCGDVYSRPKGEVLDPHREPEDVLTEIRQVNPYVFSAQYLQEPIPVEGNIIRPDWFRTYASQPVLESGDQIVQSWDTAVTVREHSDYSACSTWLYRRGKKQFFLLDVTRAKLEYPNLKSKVLQHRKGFRASVVLIEFAGLGAALVQDLPREGLHPIPIRPIEDKLTRISVQSTKIQAGQVFLPERAPWLGDFRTEVLGFPNGSNDDQVDSMSQFLRWTDDCAIPSIIVGRYGPTFSR